MATDFKATTRASISPGNNLNPAEFEKFRKFLKDACGISLAENKQYLVTTRIRRILADNNIGSLGELVSMMSGFRNSALKQQVIDAMTTNETFWFRDTYPYDYLKSTLLGEAMTEKGFGSIKVWSAACSSGQEPYSISMTVEEFRRQNMGNLPRQVDIVATDLSSAILQQAKTAEYDKMSVLRGLTPERLDAFFDKLPNDLWRVKPAVKNRVQFRSLNLQDSFSTLGKFDMIFCRNVLIYFSAELKEDILRRMHQILKPGGMLILGSSEGLAGAADLFEMVHCKPGIMYRAK
jgi:chemotaxis protein methyltransferase CheR